MPEYEVKVWVQIEAVDENEAEAKVGALLDLLPSNLASWAVEGEGSTYEIEVP